MRGLQKGSFDNMLAKTQRRLKMVEWEMEQTAKAAQSGSMEAAYKTAFGLAAQAERLAILTRELPAHTGHANAPFELNDMLLDTCEITVGYTDDGWFSVQMPALLPRKETGSADYVRTMLYPSLHQFFLSNPPYYLDRCVVVFRHVYEQSRPERECRDHDNIELNMVVDMLAMYTMKDDSPLRCRHYYCSAAGDANRTEVYVVPQRDFAVWLEKESGYGLHPIRLHDGIR